LGAKAFVSNLIDDALNRGRPICVDSQILILYFAAEEPTFSLVAPILQHPVASVVVSAVTLSEVITLPRNDPNWQDIDSVRQDVISLPRLDVVDFGQSHAVQTAIVRVQTGLRLPDAAVVATARLAGAIGVLGNDRRWKNKPLGVPYQHLDDILALIAGHHGGPVVRRPHFTANPCAIPSATCGAPVVGSAMKQSAR
jgi:PIN domain nuclease of toxin-antitoxin system